jgi:hypothetical protein
MFHAWRALALGDAIVFTGESALQFIPEVNREHCAPLAADHGKPLSEASQATLDALALIGIDVPTQPERLDAFILPCQRSSGGNA